MYFGPWQYKESFGHGKCWYRFADERYAKYTIGYFIVIVPDTSFPIQYHIQKYNIDIQFPIHSYSSITEAQQAVDDMIQRYNKLFAFT